MHVFNSIKSHLLFTCVVRIRWVLHKMHSKLERLFRSSCDIEVRNFVSENLHNLLFLLTYDTNGKINFHKQYSEDQNAITAFLSKCFSTICRWKEILNGRNKLLIINGKYKLKWMAKWFDEKTLLYLLPPIHSSIHSDFILVHTSSSCTDFNAAINDFWIEKWIWQAITMLLGH